jgi:linalool 8-monooxygenase
MAQRLKIMVASRKASIDAGGDPDVKCPDLYRDDKFHAVFSQLRAERPVYWNAESDTTGFWVISRYQDVIRVIQDPKTFSAAIQRGGMRIFNKLDVNGAPPKPSLLSLDPPTHTQLRRALMPLFSTQRINRMESTIRDRIATLIDRIAPLGKAEFVSAIAAPLTLGTLIELLNVPVNDSEDLYRWSNALIGEDDDDYTSSNREKCVAEVDAYAARLFGERVQAHGQDLISLLARATINGIPMDLDTFSSNLAMFIVAGNETTRHAITAGMFALSRFPTQRAKLLADATLMESAVNEIIRWATPAMHIRRTAVTDVEIGGQTIKKGDKVVVWYISANRDEKKWTKAHQFDVSRFLTKSATPHLAFGSGPHLCLGRRLAELQLKIALEQLLRRLPDIEVTDAPRRLRSNFIAGIKEMHVAFTPEGE